jgi:hypothetical protein
MDASWTNASSWLRWEFSCEPVVMGLTSRQGEPDRQAIGTDHRMDLAGQPANGDLVAMRPKAGASCSL